MKFFLENETEIWRIFGDRAGKSRNWVSARGSLRNFVRGMEHGGEDVACNGKRNMGGTSATGGNGRREDTARLEIEWLRRSRYPMENRTYYPLHRGRGVRVIRLYRHNRTRSQSNYNAGRYYEAHRLVNRFRCAHRYRMLVTRPPAAHTTENGCLSQT